MLVEMGAVGEHSTKAPKGTGKRSGRGERRRGREEERKRDGERVRGEKTRLSPNLDVSHGTHDDVVMAWECVNLEKKRS